MDPNTSGCSIHSSPSTASSHALTSFQSPETQLSWSDWLATVDGPEVETSTTTTTTSPDTQMPATSSSEPATSQQPPAKIRRKPVPGKGFRKTRSGCFNCKRRRVKCTETRPTCLGCRRLALDCVYPPRPESPDLCRPVRTRVPCGGTYTATVDLDHLRFFNHFLVGGHPPHPYGTGASVWKDVASLAHQHDFLACALLGLAAQHLTLFSHADCSVQALGLRVSAIKGLNDALSRPCIAVTDTDARYAAAIILTYQSAYMPNGLMDLLHMMRGWMTISETLVLDPNDSLFRGLTRESFVGSMREYLKDLPGPKGSPMMDDFFASLSLITPLCQSDAELRYLAALENLGTLARGSPVDAFLEMVPCYALTNKMTDDEFSQFVDPANSVAQVLIAHFLVLNHALELQFVGSKRSGQYAFSKEITRAWIQNISENLPGGFERYIIWPLAIMSLY